MQTIQKFNVNLGHRFYFLYKPLYQRTEFSFITNK